MTDTHTRVVTRHPTVTLTADNIERLKRCPLPPRDNGIGQWDQVRHIAW